MQVTAGDASSLTKVNKGSVHSKTLGQRDARQLSLAGTRKLISAMSSFSAIDKFCTPSGITITDESINLIEYLNMEPVPAAEMDPSLGANPNSVPALNVYFKSNLIPTDPSSRVSAPASTANTGSSAPAGKTADLEGNLATDGKIQAAVAGAGADADKSSAAYLDSDDWAKVLSNCGVFYGWIVDQKKNRIVRAPKAAFQIKSRLDQDPVSSVPDFTKPEEADSSGQGDSTSNEHRDGEEKHENENSGEDTNAEEGDQGDGDKADGEQGKDNNGDGEEKKGDRSQDPSSTQEAIQMTKNDKGIPNFRVHDESRIDITSCEHEFEVSMARNDFSSESTEASMSVLLLLSPLNDESP